MTKEEYEIESYALDVVESVVDGIVDGRITAEQAKDYLDEVRYDLSVIYSASRSITEE